MNPCIEVRDRCSPIPSEFVTVTCTSLNRRWIHPCHSVGMCFSVAEGYACPFCKATFESQRDGLGSAVE